MDINISRDSDNKTWTIEVDRVPKGSENLVLFRAIDAVDSFVKKNKELFQEKQKLPLAISKNNHVTGCKIVLNENPTTLSPEKVKQIEKQIENLKNSIQRATTHPIRFDGDYIIIDREI